MASKVDQKGKAKSKYICISQKERYVKGKGLEMPTNSIKQMAIDVQVLEKNRPKTNKKKKMMKKKADTCFQCWHTGYR